MVNRLADATSPYLLQHKDNPVAWWPWCDEALAEAKKRDAPIFLSIGYATCHWCHVMAHECFEDEEVASALNDAFVCIKVDREERPDIDDVYMAACQMMSGSGGWPLTIFATPEGAPFFAGTFFPKHSRGNRPGIIDLATQVKTAWQGKRKELIHQGNHLLGHLSQRRAMSPATLNADDVRGCAKALMSTYDDRFGGFGRAPKFPSLQNVLFLLQEGTSQDQPAWRHAAMRTLRAMRAGGIRDHIGGGFHRYSTDAHWVLPHFEKMLYDQAMAIYAYAEALRLGETATRDVLEQTVAYVLRDLRDEAGGFYSGEDADSEGVEGKYYVWTLDELTELLGEDAAVFCTYYQVRAGGNHLDEATQQATGQNVLMEGIGIEATANRHHMSKEAVSAALMRARAKVFEARKQRVRPSLDDKVLADWNGLMLAALSHASAVTGNPTWLKAANELRDFMANRMRDSEGRLCHTWRRGKLQPYQFLDDHAYLLWGLIEYHQASFDAKALAWATELADTILETFKGPDGFTLSPPSQATEVVRRPISPYDGALPNALSTAAWNMERLARLTGHDRFSAAAHEIVASFGETARTQPRACVMLHHALASLHGRSAEVFVCGESAIADEMVAVARAAPSRPLIMRPHALLERVAPWTKEIPTPDIASAYVCVDHACQAPIETSEGLAQQLN